MAYLDHVTCVRFQTDSFQNSPLSPIRAKAASASDALFGRQAGLRRSPYLRQAAALLQAQDATPRPIPLFAPTIYMLFRPEQKHGLSGKDNVLVPIAGRDGYMD